MGETTNSTPRGGIFVLRRAHEAIDKIPEPSYPAIAG
jgi:hypothetical protein